MDALTVILWLCSPAETPPPRTPTLLESLVVTPLVRNVCIDLEILKPEESKMYFRGGWEFHSDLAIMRKRYDSCKELPRLAPNRDRLPAIETCDEALTILTKRIDDAKNSAALNCDWRDRIESEVYRLHGVYCFWSAIKAAKQGSRESLAVVLAVITPEDWLHGRWPSPWE
jgi:hypothetical protein